MSFKWEKSTIITDNGEEVEAISPVIISASRETDIPAFYSDWFLYRFFDRGYVVTINPFNQRKSYVSFNKTRVIVFWSKYPAPLIKNLYKLDKNNINYYFLFTLNDYENDNLEPYLPPLSKRIEIFKKLSNLIGKERVLWRFDPLIITDKINLDSLIEKIKHVGDKIYKFTERLIISFIDVEIYRKVKLNLKKYNINYKKFTLEDIYEFSEKLSLINKEWRLDIRTCAESIDLSRYGILPNKCIDDELMIRLFYRDKQLMDFLGYNNKLFYSESKKLKDKGQRKFCNCIVSKDIGRYNSCPFLCRYCYANSNEKIVKEIFTNHNFRGEMI